MQIVKKSETINVNPSPGTTIHEYFIDEPSISGATTEINGRYPERGFAVNEVSKELVYILSGKGAIVTKTGKSSFAPGAVIFIDKKEPFAWQGTFSMFMVTTPKFDPEQHKIL